MRISLGDFNKSKEKLMTDRNITSEEATQYLMKLGPQRLFKMGLLERDGWRESFTKKSLEKRKQENRKKTKALRKQKQLSARKG